MLPEWGGYNGSSGEWGAESWSLVIRTFTNWNPKDKRWINIPVLLLLHLLDQTRVQFAEQPITPFSVIVCKLPAVQPSLKEEREEGEEEEEEAAGAEVGWIYSLERH